MCLFAGHNSESIMKILKKNCIYNYKSWNKPFIVLRAEIIENNTFLNYWVSVTQIETCGRFESISSSIRIVETFWLQSREGEGLDTIEKKLILRTGPVNLKSITKEHWSTN